jgi:hypothetical protein
MAQKSGSRGGAVALFVLIILLLAAANIVLVGYVVQRIMAPGNNALPIDTLRAIAQQMPDLLGAIAGAHLVAVLLGIVVLRSGQTPAGAAAPAAAATEIDWAAPGLTLLGLLQSEARLIDFLEEDIDAYNDSQVGAAVRTIHADCRKALHERMKIERVYDAEDGATVEVAAGFDPAAVRLTGNVHGQPPFRGTLQHAGWRAVDVRLPEPKAGIDHRVLAPAEVEIP